MKFGGIALVHTKWRISLLRYGTLFLLISVVIKPYQQFYIERKCNPTESRQSLPLCENPASLTKCERLNVFEFRDNFLRYVFVCLIVRNTEVTVTRVFNTTVPLTIAR